MRLLRLLIARGEIPAFFFFSFILMLLWNSLVARQLGWGPTLSYLQTAGLWFLLNLAFAWAGIGARSAIGFGQSRGFRRSGRHRGIGDHVRSAIRDDLSPERSAEDSDDLGDRIERRIKRGFARWVDADEETDWSDLGKRIERKIRRTIREWID